MAKIASSANQVTIELLNHLFDCYTSPIAGQFPNASLESKQTFRSNAPFCLFTGYYAKAQKLTPPGPVYLALGLIDLKLELTSNELTNTLHYPFTSSLAANINIAIIRLAYKAMASPLQLSVKLIKNNIRQQWR